MHTILRKVLSYMPVKLFLPGSSAQRPAVCLGQRLSECRQKTLYYESLSIHIIAIDMIDSTLALFDHMFYNLRYITLIIIQTEKAGNAAQD